MSQRYFLTAESTYEDLRQYLNTELSYPNALGKSVFQTALYAPRDFFRRVLLAVDTDLPGYSTIDSAITPLLASDAMEEIDETTYLLAVASPVEWVSTNDSRLSDQRTPTDGSVTTAKLADNAVTGAKISSTTDITCGLLTANTGISAKSLLAADWLGVSSGIVVSPVAFTLRTVSNGANQFVIDTSGFVTTGQWRSTAVAVAYGGTGATTAADARTNLGLGGAAVLNVGTAAGTVAAGDHTHSQLHDRSHAITSTSDHTAGNWKVLYTNGSGQVVELGLGDSGKALVSNGASAAPSWATAGSSSASDLTSGTLAYARMADPTVTSPSQITASQNDYASFARGINRFSTNAAYSLTGMAAGNDGEVRVITNVGTTAANTLTIKDESSSSTAANRFSVPWAGDCVIPALGSVVVFYDGTSSRWRVL